MSKIYVLQNDRIHMPPTLLASGLGLGCCFTCLIDITEHPVYVQPRLWPREHSCTGLSFLPVPMDQILSYRRIQELSGTDFEIILFNNL